MAAKKKPPPKKRTARKKVAPPPAPPRRRSRKAAEAEVPAPAVPRTAYTPELGALICFLLATGKALRSLQELTPATLAAEYPELDLSAFPSAGLPTKTCILHWVQLSRAKDERFAGFADQYARAREDYFDHEAEETTDIADTEGDPQRARVRIWARQWIASKRVPRKYGERIEITPPPGGPPPVIESPTQAAAMMDQLLNPALNIPRRQRRRRA